MINIIYLILAGFISGIVGGMGMGGGTLLIPILSIFLGFAQKRAQGINLLVFIPMSIVALVVHIKNKLVDFRAGIPIMISGILASIVGALFAMKISSIILQKLFGGFLLMVGLWQIISIFLTKKEKTHGLTTDFLINRLV